MDFMATGKVLAGKGLALRCIDCGRAVRLDESEETCPSCGGNLSVEYDYAGLKRFVTRKRLAAISDPSIWRYLDLLPVEDRRLVPSPWVGGTPLYRAPKFERALGLARVYVKDDGRNPSASFKDRASAVVVARALQGGKKVVATASTGNAASSLACLAANLPLKTIIFVPKTAPAPKLAQLLVFGTTVITVDGTYDDAFDLCREACRRYGWYNRSTGVNPFTREGKKTCAFELCEQLSWEVPDNVFVSVGDGNIISGIWKGFTEFRTLGLINRLPKLVAVQAGTSDAVARALKGDGKIKPVAGKTIADSISVSLPRDGAAAVKAVRESGGFAVTVKDTEILAAMRDVARGAGVYAEPAAAAAYAGLAKAARGGLIKSRESAVVLISGNGLKDTASALKAAGKPHFISPDLKSLEKLIRREKLV